MIPVINKKTGNQVDTVEGRISGAFDTKHRGMCIGDLLSLLISRNVEDGVLSERDLFEAKVISEDETLGQPQMTRMAQGKERGRSGA